MSRRGPAGGRAQRAGRPPAATGGAGALYGALTIHHTPAGSFGCVVLAKNTETGELVAIKKMVGPSGGGNPFPGAPAYPGPSSGAASPVPARAAQRRSPRPLHTPRGPAAARRSRKQPAPSNAPPCPLRTAQEREFLQARYVESEILNHSLLRHPHVRRRVLCCGLPLCCNLRVLWTSALAYSHGPNRTPGCSNLL